MTARAPKKAEETAPCPWCGGDVRIVGNTHKSVQCNTREALTCAANGPWRTQVREAIRAWNRVAKKASKKHG